MNPTRIRETLFVLGLCVLGAVTALQLVRSVPHAAMLYLVGGALLLVILEPFVGLIVYLAFFYIRPHELIAGFTDTPVMLVIGGATFVSMVISEGVKQRGLSLVKAPQDYLLMWLLLAFVVSHLSHARVGEAFSSGYAFLQTVVTYFLITNLVSSVRRLNIVLQWLGVLTVWVAIEGLIVYYTGSGIGGVALKGGRVVVRAFSGDPNLLAAGLMLLLPFLFLQMARPGGVGRRLYSAGAVALLCFVVLLTQSRGGAVTLAVVGTLLLIRKAGLARGAFFALLLLAVVYFFGTSRLHELNPTEPSAYGRLLAWDRAFGEFHSNPIFGVGTHQTGQGTALVPHNALMQTAAELGVFGLVPWVLLIFVTMRNAIFVSRRASGAEQGGLGLLSEALFFACMVWMVSLLFVGNPYYDELYIVVALCVAAANIFVRMSEVRYQLMEKGDFGYAVLLITLGLAMHRLVLYAVGV